MSTRVHSSDRLGVPSSVGTQIAAPNMDARPRMRRRMPNLQAPLTSSKSSTKPPATSGPAPKPPSGAPSPAPQPRPPPPGPTQAPRAGSGHKPRPGRRDSGSANHNARRDATPTNSANQNARRDATPTRSANHSTKRDATPTRRDRTPTNQRSRRPGSGGRPGSSGGQGEVGGHGEVGGQDVRFIDVGGTSSHRDRASRIHTARDTLTISPKDVLEKCEVRDVLAVYEVDLHAASVGAIENLDMFTNLRVLDLSCNHIRRIENLTHNTDIRELKLYDNDLDTLENLHTLKELSHLQLQHNRIKAIGKGLSAARRLRTLRLDSNALCRLEVREVAAVSQLTSLDLSNNRLDSVAAVSCLTNLEELIVLNNRLRTVTDLSRCRKLQEVDVSHNKIADLSGLKDLHSLRILHASHNLLTSLKTLGRLKSLQEMNVASNRLSDTRPLAESFPGTQILDISENHLESWDTVRPLSSLRELVELYVAGNPFCLPGGHKPSYHTDTQTLLPGLHILDGAHIQRPASRQGQGTPLMRPMSAASVVTSRQVESQLQYLNDEMSEYEANLSKQFESLRSTMDYFSSLSPEGSSDTGGRPVSKCGKRSRIKMAMEFASYQYDGPVQGTETCDTTETQESTESRDDTEDATETYQTSEYGD